MPTAAPQIQPMPQRQPMAQRQPMQQAKPAAAPSMAAAAPAAGGGLLNANVGAGLLGAASKIGGGPTRFPVSLGSQIGPALTQFAADYQASQLAAEKKAREQALIQKYGPEALVPGAIGEIIKGREAARQQQAMLDSLGGGTGQDAKARIEESLGLKLTNGEFQQLRVAMSSGDAKTVNTALGSIRKDKFANTTKLRDEYGKRISSTSKIIGAAQEAQRMLDTGDTSGVGDLVTLYTTITALDPDSVVREGEIALGREIISLAKRAQLQMERITEGRVIDTDTAKQMRKLVLKLGQKAQQNADNLRTFYRAEAGRFALNPDSVIIPSSRLNRSRAGGEPNVSADDFMYGG
tara:strand:+ start:4578 stop:5627 length:1050 start_codon:yes stop_codon:yes gene_type:complete